MVTIQSNLKTIYDTCANDSVCSCNGYCAYDPCPSYESAVKAHDSSYQSAHYPPNKDPYNTSDWSTNNVDKGPHCYSNAGDCTSASCSGEWACGAKQNPVYTSYKGGCYGD